MNVAIILAGGRGTRMGVVDQPKQFLDVYGKPVIIHTMEMFDNHLEIDKIAVVCLDEWHDDLRRWLRKYDINKVKWIVSAGTTRQESSYNGLKAIQSDVSSDDIVVIHDSARPLVSSKVISENINAAIKYRAVDTVIPASDTIVKSTNDLTIAEIPVRKELYIGQTPQSFMYSEIFNAHLNAQTSELIDSTDDCRLILNQGGSVYLVEGEKLNFKITTMEDLLLLKAIVKMGKLERI